MIQHYQNLLNQQNQINDLLNNIHNQKINSTLKETCEKLIPTLQKYNLHINKSENFNINQNFIDINFKETLDNKKIITYYTIYKNTVQAFSFEQNYIEQLEYHTIEELITKITKIENEKIKNQEEYKLYNQLKEKYENF